MTLEAIGCPATHLQTSRIPKGSIRLKDQLAELFPRPLAAIGEYLRKNSVI
jgi:hypothetical protein